ncbi:hypothetical protein [Aliiglaciecola litoralis]|uniref:Uncharacterized protein n=1 Tax=Aliiglaciecola litoralis TaxID=582857 RepID=A0ABP3WN89_9ALTE
MEFERQKVEQKPVRKHTVYPLILVSVGLHLALGALVLTLNKAPEKKSPKKEPIGIQAKLIYIDIEPKISHTAARMDPSDSSESAQAQIEAQPKPSPTPLVESAKTLAQRRDALPAINYNAEHEEPSAEIKSGLPVLSSRELAQQHLQVFSEQANQRLAQNQSKQYQQAKVSPDLQLPTIDPFITEDEKIMQQNTVQVNCSSGLNKAIANISGALGGNVKCTQMPQLNQFIDYRLNKTALTGEQ